MNGLPPHCSCAGRLPATYSHTQHACIPGAQASQRSSPQLAGLVCAARRDDRALAQALTLAAAELVWLPDFCHWKSGHARNGFRVPLRPRTLSRLLFIRSSAGAAQVSLIPGARLTAAPRSPPCGICPTTPHPRLRLLYLGSPLRPQVVIKSRRAKHCLLADHLSDRLTLQEITCFSLIVLRFLFIDYHTACW